MSDLFLALGIVGLAGAVACIGYGAAWARGVEHRLARLEHHGPAKRASVEATETVLVQVARLLDQHSVLGAQLGNLQLISEYMRATGNTDPVWTDVVKWKAQQSQRPARRRC